MTTERIQYADDDISPIKRLLSLRFPPLLIGLFLGLILSFVVSRFEEVLSQNIAVAFFIPFVVYLASAVGAQTQSIYVRDLKSGKASFKIYLFKETTIGMSLGLVFSLISAPIIYLWFRSSDLTWAVSLAVLGAIASAPLIALLVTEILQIEHHDPAVGAGPISTVIQDTVSVLIYGAIASAIIL